MDETKRITRQRPTPARASRLIESAFAMLVLLAPSALAADFHQVFFEGFGDTFRPRGSSLGPFSTAGAGGFSVGFRPIRYLQIDGASVEFIAAGSASNDRVVYGTYSNGGSAYRLVQGHPSMLNIGVRFVLPLAHDRVLLSAGPALTGLMVNEAIVPQPNVVDTCSSCQSRRGWGPSGIAEIMFFPEDSRRIGLGVHVRYVQIDSNVSLRTGLSGPAPASDRFILIGGTVSFRFH
jgi:hypothetical protein